MGNSEVPAVVMPNLFRAIAHGFASDRSREALTLRDLVTECREHHVPFQ